MTEARDNERLNRKDSVPGEPMLEELLGGAYPAYREVLMLAGDCPREWKYYGRKHGWHLKVMKGRKALVYLSPLDGSFRVGFALRENEKEALLMSKLPPALKEELRSAKKFPEGYPLRIPVSGKSGMQAVRLVIGVLLPLR